MDGHRTRARGLGARMARRLFGGVHRGGVAEPEAAAPHAPKGQERDPMKTLAAATAAVATLVLTGCWSDGPFGSSGTCTSNNHHISYITWWPSQLYTPVIFNTYLTVNLGGPYQETDPAR